MSTVWMTLLKFVLSVAITSIGKIPASDWAKLGTVLAAWIQKLEDTLPAASPVRAIFRNASIKQMSPPSTDKPGSDKWAN